MAKTAKAIYDEIVAYIDSNGIAYTNWCAGTTSDAKTRLFKEHNVSDKGVWIYRSCASAQDARGIADSLRKLGCEIAPGSGDDSATIIYAYMETGSTNP